MLTNGREAGVGGGGGAGALLGTPTAPGGKWRAGLGGKTKLNGQGSYKGKRSWQ